MNVFLKFPLVFLCNYQNRLVILKIKNPCWFLFSYPRKMGKTRWNCLRKNNYTAYKTYDPGHPSIYKINYKHEQGFQKSGKQMSKSTTGDKPAWLITSSSCLNRSEHNFLLYEMGLFRKLRYIT